MSRTVNTMKLFAVPNYRERIAADPVIDRFDYRFEEENKPGVISRETYSTWWNGGLRTAAYFHNQIGILTETGVADPAPRKIMPRAERLQPPPTTRIP